MKLSLSSSKTQPAIKSGGAVDAKSAASQGYALGMYWGKNQSDFAVYSFKLDRDADAVMLEMRFPEPGHSPIMFSLTARFQMVMLKPTGGFGFQNSEWQLDSVLLGGISEGNIKSWSGQPEAIA
jgi:hypothetical protein